MAGEKDYLGQLKELWRGRNAKLSQVVDMWVTSKSYGEGISLLAGQLKQCAKSEQWLRGHFGVFGSFPYDRKNTKNSFFLRV